ncbi:hypothetical protein EST38_g11875 [Candolleomyces aberdarensis]|uniref:Uncharacterized protein n=1 Tax=Candolleomyces aberdarensis TaxID=2316362 RepID=A0A4Q2D749_9AGAR|nr:hypothetical protein EST38_g11875 [Candolleomyces aberdarensis]
MAGPVVTQAAPRKPRAKPGEGISKEMRELAVERFGELRMEFYLAADESDVGFLPPQSFLPDEAVQKIIDDIYRVSTTNDIASRTTDVPSLSVSQTHRLQSILNLCNSLKSEFTQLRDAKKRKKNVDVQPDFVVVEEQDRNLVIASSLAAGQTLSIAIPS